MKEHFHNISRRREWKWCVFALALLILSACTFGPRNAVPEPEKRNEIDTPEDAGEPEESGESSDYRPLTPEELAEFEDYFNGDSLRNGLLRFAYDSFADVPYYLELLFYDAGEPVTDETERAAAMKLAGLEAFETDCTKLTTDFIVQSLNTYLVPDSPCDREWLERTLEELEWPPSWYLPEYDAYYMIHGDTNMADYTFTGGWHDELGRIALEYTATVYHWTSIGYDIEWERPMRATLLPYPDGWKVAANQRTNS